MKKTRRQIDAIRERKEKAAKWWRGQGRVDLLNAESPVPIPKAVPTERGHGVTREMNAIEGPKEEQFFRGGGTYTNPERDKRRGKHRRGKHLKKELP